ncbi:adenylosuccinate synthetase [Falsiroseomonas sp. HW251]|uniref:adenylosuccinate synthetase n=1 Tax=Falsiroseomonas sp. HW251 TaxID=3390998 RepID=UPI003D31880A
MTTPRTAEVVIGANFGDEGKGLFTDFHAARLGAGTTVIRFNGGAQAGHTVTLADGRRHVFHHVGAGAFAGAGTFLSRFFIANPLVLERELQALAGLGVAPAIALDPAAPLTTPFDMMANQMAEEARGAARHGSTGLGINETVTRMATRFATRAGDLAYRDALRRQIVAIRDEYLPARLAALNVIPDETWRRRIADPATIEWFLDAGEATLLPRLGALPPSRGLVFEGAQGLLLDERHEFFPHVTRSRTGLTNVLTLAREAGIDRLEVTYATRAYLTRHGAGPFPREKPGLAFADATNRPNPWQGTLRFGWLDLDLLARTIHADLAQAAGVRIAATLGVTCLNQVGDHVPYWRDGTRQLASPEALVAAALEAAGLGRALVSDAPTRESVARVAPRRARAA